jgi:salicylate hydroxylase
VLLAEALNLGAIILTHAEVIAVADDESSWRQVVSLKDGRHLSADVVVGADGKSIPAHEIIVKRLTKYPGLWSMLREYVLDRPFPPEETGDLAYRGTFTREQLLAFQDEGIDKLMEASNVQVWLGPGRHAVFYPLRGHTEYNLVLLCVMGCGNSSRMLTGIKVCRRYARRRSNLSW